MNNKIIIFKHMGREWTATLDDCGIDNCVVTITKDLRLDWEQEMDTESFTITLDKTRIAMWEI